MAPDFVGRPNLPALAPALGGCVAAFVLINSDNQIATPVGLGIGALACSYTIKIEFDRFNETKDDPLDWPGPKVFPGFVGVRRVAAHHKRARLHERDLIKFLANL